MKGVDSHSDNPPVGSEHEILSFLAGELHDFRAPLSAVYGYCSLLGREQLGTLTPTQIEVVQRMKNVVERLSHMAADMFDLCAGKDMARGPRRAPVDVGEVVRQAVHQVAPLAAEKHVSLSMNLELPPRMPEWDGYQVEQILINLLENACKFSSACGSVEVRGCPVEDVSYRIDVRDSGRGIPAAVMPHVFDEYFSHASGGASGLGLANCRRIAAAHGGRIWAESSEAGAVFSFELPMRANASAEESLSLAAAVSLQ